ncbi:MAG: ABC transporter ATP-binding protein [Pyrinomonadaceae bacterium]|nr:ABC transporter ATP-binding protein [Pyrinomonadaceae bacterium]
MKSIITVENISKKYRIGARDPYQTLRDSLADAFRNPLGKLRSRLSAPTMWALSGIDFAVQPGEVLGLIGTNGAGKSTLLKILSRIVEPTSGRVDLYGRVGSLLEVGTGFHPELTGRENVFLNGAILGMRREYIKRRFDEIVEFAEIEKFIDTAVKYYSSGMYMRLAFAVAAHLEPEILIIDEVLAVGDVAFQKKCLGKMGEVAQTGRTVLFVSHNMVAVQNLCSRVIWLNQGKISADGEPREIISMYLRTSLSVRAEQTWEDIESAPGNHEARIRRACVHPAGGTPMDAINIRTPVVIEFEYWNLVPGAFLNLSVVVSTEEGYPIFNTGSGNEPVWHGRPFPAGLFRSAFYIPGELLNDGTHRVHLYIIKDRSIVLFHLEDILVFDVEDSLERDGWFGKWIGAVRPNFTWQTELVEGGNLSSTGFMYGEE